MLLAPKIVDDNQDKDSDHSPELVGPGVLVKDHSHSLTDSRVIHDVETNDKPIKVLIDDIIDKYKDPATGDTIVEGPITEETNIKGPEGDAFDKKKSGTSESQLTPLELSPTKKSVIIESKHTPL